MPLNILWTGGWDSTFRVLQAALTEGNTVQPYYLIDVGRNSTLHELRAMNRIRRRANERTSTKQDANERDASELGGGRILPIRFYDKDGLTPDPVVSSWYEALKGRMHLGTQYEWLATFVRQHGVDALELCVQDNPPEHRMPFYQMLRAHATGQGHACRVVPPADSPLQLFAPFRFPVLHLTKSDMGAEAEAAGFRDLLDDTWFCHNPILGEPCGMCAPCTMLETTTGRSLAPHPLVMVRRMLGQAKRYALKRLAR